MALHKAGWTGKKIAEEMGISEATVWSRISKMREEGKL
ncbi:HTH domain-containing protein [Lachnospiraceae bacterium 54-53]